MKQAETLEVSSPTKREIAMTRVFDAPRRLVFDALTRPDLLDRWLLGPPGWSLVVCDIDLRVGGSYRYVWQDADGTGVGMDGEYREIVAPSRIVVTESFGEPWSSNAELDTIVLVEEGGKTKLTLTVRYESREARDDILETPMRSGIAESYSRLDELLASMG